MPNPFSPHGSNGPLYVKSLLSIYPRFDFLISISGARMQSCYQSLLLAVQATGSSSQDPLLAIKRDRNKSTWRSESISRQRQMITELSRSHDIYARLTICFFLHPANNRLHARRVARETRALELTGCTSDRMSCRHRDSHDGIGNSLHNPMAGLPTSCNYLF